MYNMYLSMATSSPPMRPPEVLSAVDGCELSDNFDHPREVNAVPLLKKGRCSRSNTAEEKIKMRRDRIRRKKRGSKLAKLKNKVVHRQCELRSESSQKAKAELNVIAFKNRARTF